MDHNDIIMIRYDSINNELSYGKYGNVSILGVGYWESMSRLETLFKRMFKGMYFEWETSNLRNCLVTISDRELCNSLAIVIVTLVQWHYKRIIA